MALPALFSRRKRQAASLAPDVYTYDDFPQKIRVQIVHILIEGLGRYEDYSPNVEYWKYITETMRKEKGTFHLTGQRFTDYSEEYCTWLLAESDVPTFLDGVELGMRAISAIKGEYRQDKYKLFADELNARLQESAIGFELHLGELIQIDTQVIHSEVVMPALQLLHDPRFAGAENEYRDAHRYFRSGDYETCLIECGKAFESVLKVIGARRAWTITQNDPASKLLKAAYDSGFIPAYMQSQFSGLKSVLESGVPTIRNRQSGHGAGGQVRQVDKHLAAYQLHQTAAAIVFLADHDRAMP